jgi:hypothetical protein
MELDTRIVNIKSHYGGLGDAIARIPSYKWAIMNQRHCVFYIFVPDFFVEFCNIIMKSELEGEDQATYQILPLSLWERRLKSNSTYTVGFDPLQITSLSMHLVDHGFLNVNNRLPANDEERSYPVWKSPSHEQRKRDEYVVVTTGFTSEVREWKVEEINKFIDLVKTKTSLNVVLLGAGSVHAGPGVTISGKFDEAIKAEACEDLRDQTTITQAADILARASAVVGVDNGLLHLASCTDVPVIWGFTSVDPKHRIPVRNSKPGYNAYTVLPSVGLDCRFCQSKYHFFEHNFKKCLRQRMSNEESIPCLPDMKAESFFKILKTRILK